MPIALANAYFDSVPFPAVTGNVPTTQFNRGAFQETYRHFQADFPSTVRAYCKRVYQPTRPEQVAIAKFWTSEGGQRVVHAAQHLHGGLGVDRDYPLHRYFLWAKELELTLGGATASLLGLGAILAAEPV